MTNNKREPLLSICVPTFNRAGLLGDLLLSIRSQEPLCRELEVIICDNASSDDTRGVVRACHDHMPIRYHRNTENIGGPKNILLSVSLARGSFCWVIGDDDIMCVGAIAKMIELLKKRPDLLAVIVGYSYEPIDRRGEVCASVSRGQAFPFSRPVYDLNQSQGFVGRWEETFRFSSIPAIHTAIVGTVFRRAEWCTYASEVSDAIEDVNHGSLASTFPQSLIWARCLSGKEVYFHAEPLVYFFVGAQSWLDRWPAMLFTRVLELSVFFSSAGCDRQCVEYYQSIILSDPVLRELLVSRRPYDLETFSVRRLLCLFGDRACLWRNLIAWSRGPSTLSHRLNMAISLKWILIGISLVRPVKCRSFLRFCLDALADFLFCELRYLGGKLQRTLASLGLRES